MKKILIGLGSVIALFAVAVLVVPGFIDWSGYRAQIAQEVKKATQRDLLIGGDISLSLLPSPVLKVSDVHFANAKGAQSPDMFSARQVDVRVALMPLLGGTIHVQSIRMIKPVINLEILADGRGNWVFEPADVGDKISTPTRSDEPSFQDAEKVEDYSLPLQIDDFIIEDGTLFFSNPAQAVREEITDINSRFAIGALNGPFEAAATMKIRGIPVGLEGSVGQVVYGRTASFASQITLAHGNVSSRFTGTFVNLSEGPKVKGKITMTGESLAGMLSAFDGRTEQPGGLNRAFSLDGEISATSKSLSFGEDGLTLSLGQDRGMLQLTYKEEGQKTLEAQASFSKIDADAWIEAKPYQVIAPAPLKRVITPSNLSEGRSGSRVSAVLDSPKREMPALKKEASSFSLPTDLEARLALNVEALILKDDAVRQLQVAASLNEGAVALERFSALLPGAGEVNLVGVAGAREGELQFDGSLDVNITHLRGMLKWLDVDVASVQAGRLQQLALTSQIAANSENIRLYDVLARMDGSTVKGASTIALRSRPSFGASLALDRLNADAYLASPVSVQPVPSSVTSSSTTAEPTSVKQAPVSASPFKALKLLKEFDANLNLTAGQITYQKQNVKNVVLNATIYNGGVEIQKASVGSLAGVSIAASGALKPDENGLNADNLSVSASGKSFVGAARMFGAGQVLNWKKIGPLSAKATLNGNLLAPDVDLHLNGLGTSVIVAGQVDALPVPKGEASVNLQIADLSKLTRGLGLSYQPSARVGGIDLNSDVIFDLSQVSLKNITGQVGPTSVSGDMLYKQGTKPYVNMALKMGQLRLDPFMAKQTSVPQNRSVAHNNRPSSTSTVPRSTNLSSRWSQEPIDLSMLSSVDADIHLKIAALLRKKMKAENLEIKAQQKEGVLVIEQARGDVFGGEISATSKIVGQQQAQIETQLKARGIKLKQFLTQTGSKTQADGGVSGTAHLSTVGISEFDLVSNLKGQADLALQKVSVGGKGKQGSPLDILNLLAVLSGTNPAKGLADVNAKVDITQGVARLRQAVLSSKIANGSATGSVDLPRWFVDVSGQLKMQQNALVGLIAQQAKMKQDYPFSIKGQLDVPNVKLDTGGVSSGGGLIIPLPDNLEQKGYGTLIRGLLGKGGVKTSAPQQETPPIQPPASGGTMAPPPPPPSSSQQQNQPPSMEQQLLQGLGDLLRR
ncbi:AsmA family protein [Terasakiella sp. SH-1]|uniref:AsmA family protein n=1 Tax=Terasakiella sp. SH-1 TaxID=2560057 RepID=UPI001430128E|nr:AsmA family protein [Terasakiella sp. SH-1]